MKKVTVVMGMILAMMAIIEFPCYGKVMNGCYHKINGQLRIVNGAANCDSIEVFIQWNEDGPAGPQGIQGTQGPQGPKGDQGIQGIPGTIDLTKIYYVRHPTLADPITTTNVYCRPGDIAISGGAQCTWNTTVQNFLVLSEPVSCLDVLTGIPYPCGWMAQCTGFHTDPRNLYNPKSITVYCLQRP